MMKTITTCLVSLLAISLMAGCAFVRPVDSNELTTAEKATAITNTTREVTILAINKIWEGDDKKADRIGAAGQLAQITDEIVDHIFDKREEPLTRAVESQLLNIIPEEYKGLFVAAYEALNMYYEFPAAADVLPETEATLLRAFFVGLRDGAKKVLEAEGVVIMLPHDNP